MSLERCLGLCGGGHGLLNSFFVEVHFGTPVYMIDTKEAQQPRLYMSVLGC